jgi:hypothetical protein
MPLPEGKPPIRAISRKGRIIVIRWLASTGNWRHDYLNHALALYGIRKVCLVFVG